MVLSPDRQKCTSIRTDSKKLLSLSVERRTTVRYVSQEKRTDTESRDYCDVTAFLSERKPENKQTYKQTNKQIQSTNANDDPHANFSSHPFLHKSVFFIESMCDYLAGVSWWTVPGHSALLKSVSSYAGHQMNNRQHVIQHPVLFGHAICTKKSMRLLVGEPTVSAHTQRLTREQTLSEVITGEVLKT